jgi:serine/threonine-protein kinase
MAFLQDYTMLDELGRGGFASVYKVRHNDLGYVRAIRVLNEIIVAKRGEDPKQSKTYRKFLDECRVLLRLGNGNHPNIVHIYKPDLLENKALVEMDFVDGQDLLHYLKQNNNFVPTDEVIRMAQQISSALAYCHEDIYRYCMDRELDNLQDDPNDGSKVLLDDATRQRLIDKYKVIHNDLHSGNIMRRENGNFVLLDFGLAINGDEVVLSSSRHANGAPEYKSPEKWDDDSTLTEQSDIYSFGIVLFQYLAGRVPFPYNTSTSGGFRAEAELCKAHQEATPPSIEDLRREMYERKYEGRTYSRDFPAWLEEAILKCLNKAPEDRFRNGKELYEFIISHTSQTTEPEFPSASMESDSESEERIAMLENKLSLTKDELARAKKEILTLQQEIQRLKGPTPPPPPQPRFCRVCGNMLKPDAKFCNQCGTPINN